MPVAEGERDGAGEHVAPVASRVDAELAGCGPWLDPDLEGNDAASGSGERPDCAAVGACGNGPDDHVLVRGGVDEGADVDLQGLGQNLEQVEAEGSLAGFDAADRGGAEVGAGGECVERPAPGFPQPA